MSTRLFPARFNQNCTGCNLKVSKGEPIGYTIGNNSPTCEDCVEEGMPNLPNPRYKQDYGLPEYVREALERRANREVIIWSLLNEKVDGKTKKTKLLVHIPAKAARAEAQLKEILGRAKFQAVTDLNGTVWYEVAKTHADKLIDGLQSRYKGVWVHRRFYTTEYCTGSCQGADLEKTPRSECECVCGGASHAGGAGNWVAPTGDDLLISHEEKQTSTYYSIKRNEIW